MLEEYENKLVPNLTILEQIKSKFIESGEQQKAESYEPCHLSLGVTHTAVIVRSGELLTAGSKLDGQLGVKF